MDEVCTMADATFKARELASDPHCCLMVGKGRTWTITSLENMVLFPAGEKVLSHPDVLKLLRSHLLGHLEAKELSFITWPCQTVE